MERTLPATRRLPALDWRRHVPFMVNVASLVVLGWFALFLGTWARGLDSLVYYHVDPTDPYRNATLGTLGAYLYSPAFAQLAAPLQNLSWPAFHTLIVAVELGALAIIVGPPLAVLLAVLQVPLIWTDLEYANVNIVLTALVALAIRRPYLWAPAILLKASPAIGLVWYAVRREWRNLGIAAGVTVAVLLLSILIGGVSHWIDWYTLVLRGNDAQADGWNAIPLLVRDVLAVGIVAWGGLTNRTWAIPLALAIAVAIYNPGFLMVLGVVYLARRKELHAVTAA